MAESLYSLDMRVIRLYEDFSGANNGLETFQRPFYDNGQISVANLQQYTT